MFLCSFSLIISHIVWVTVCTGTFVCMHMYICLYVRLYVCIYTRVYACMHVSCHISYWLKMRGKARGRWLSVSCCLQVCAGTWVTVLYTFQPHLAGCTFFFFPQPALEAKVPLDRHVPVFFFLTHKTSLCTRRDQICWYRVLVNINSFFT